MPRDYMEFLEEAEELQYLLGDIVGPGEDFAESVLSSLLSVIEWVEDNEHVTEKQWKALKNWREGAKKWLD